MKTTRKCEIKTICVICGSEFVYTSYGNRPRKTCKDACRTELRKRCGGFKFDQSPDDPSPDEIARRARIIREINESNKRAANGRPMIQRSELDWY